MTDVDQSLDFDALLDPARLAAAWQRPAPVRSVEIEGVAPADAADETEAEPDADGEAFTAEPTHIDPPVRRPALPIARAHQRFLDEIEHTLAAAPALADKARRVLAAPLAQLAHVLAPLDLEAAEVAIDQLEDLWQALLSDAGWPHIPDRDED